MSASTGNGWCGGRFRICPAVWIGGAVFAVALSVGAFSGSAGQNDASTPETNAPDQAEDHRHFGSDATQLKRGRTVRLATYNALNLFDDHDDPALSGDVEDLEMTKPADQLEALSEAIREVDADILAMQEIETERALRWFVDAYLIGMGYEHIVSIDAGDGRGIENAVLSRFPIVETEVWPGLELGGVHPPNWGNQENRHAGELLRFRRSPLRVVIDVDEEDEREPYRMTLFVVHHKSGYGGGYWRLAEAEKVIELVERDEAEGQGANIAILGDLNCEPDDPPYRAYIEAGLKDVLADRRSNEAAFVTHESGRVIDHILVNGALSAEVAPSSAFVLGTPSRPPGADWRTTAPPEGFASDHFPVAVDITPADK